MVTEIHDSSLYNYSFRFLSYPSDQGLSLFCRGIAINSPTSFVMFHRTFASNFNLLKSNDEIPVIFVLFFA